MDNAQSAADLEAEILEKEIDGVYGEVHAARWTPNSGPQMDAYFCKADVLWYGGAAGGGKTSLLIGVALNRQKQSRIYRKKSVDLAGIVQDFISINGSKQGLKQSPNVEYWDADRHIEFGHMQYAGDEEKYQGRARSAHLFDEAVHFSENQVEFVLGWMRSASGEKCRAILASNPPLTTEGEWIIAWFAPWVDEDWPEEDKAEPGEIRWSIHDRKSIHWVPRKAAYRIVDDQPEEHCSFAEYLKLEESERQRLGLLVPRSYSFIPARLDDNPYLRDTDYRQSVMAMDEPMRSKLLYGDRTIKGEDDLWQIIPTDWIKQAQDRWSEDGWRENKMTRIGVDVAQGGPDKTVFVPRHDWWFDEPKKYKGSETPDGTAVVSLLTPIIKDGAICNVDVGGGYGNDTFRQLQGLGINVAACNGGFGSDGNDRTGKIKFRNKRAEWLMGLREALDPRFGRGLALPPGREVRMDLASYRWKPAEGNVRTVEDKEKQKERLGRSPDVGDAIIYAYAKEAIAAKPEPQSGPIQTTSVNSLRISKRR